MHYYKRNLGDYAKKAGRLSMLQHGSYTLLIDACYDREQFPTKAEAIDWTWASSTAEIEAVEFVLSKFFVLTDGVYVQSRIQEELADYHQKAETNARIAREREEKRNAAKTERERTVNEPLGKVDEAPPNHKPLTNNQEPVFTGESAPAENQDADSSDLEQPVTSSIKTLACIAMRRNGLATLNTENPKLQALIDQGATPELFAAATVEAIAAGKGTFNYILGKVEGQMTEAAVIRQTPMARPDTRQTTETAHQRQQREHVEALAPRAARKAPGSFSNPYLVDITELRNVPAIASR
jgi:uncharacterized protein YdaU (DUF1376 family)